MKERIERLLCNVAFFIVMMFSVAWIWCALEIGLYGEVQTRIVDGWMMLVFGVVVIVAYVYGRCSSD